MMGNQFTTFLLNNFQVLFIKVIFKNITFYQLSFRKVSQTQMNLLKRNSRYEWVKGEVTKLNQ